MPWIHCDETLTDDVQECPSCGARKERWTARIDKTRMFQLSNAWQLEGLEFDARDTEEEADEDEDDDWNVADLGFKAEDTEESARAGNQAKATKQEEEVDWEVEELGFEAEDTSEDAGEGGQQTKATKQDGEDEDWDVASIEVDSSPTLP